MYSNRLMRKMRWLALVLCTAAALNACSLNHPADRFGRIPSWEAEWKPGRVCQNDPVRIAYRFPVYETDAMGSTRAVIAQCDGARLPAGATCASFYPRLQITPDNLFQGGVMALNAYQGELTSEPLRSDAPLQITLRVDRSSPSYATNASGARGILSPHPSIRYTDVSQPITLNIDPIDTGATQLEPVVFSGQCQGSSPAWTPINLEIGQTRSAAVKLRRICNRENNRALRFIATFTGAPSSTSDSLAPGACMDFFSENEPYIVRSIGVIPGADPTAVGPLCMNGADSPPPPPIRAELSFGCE